LLTELLSDDAISASAGAGGRNPLTFSYIFVLHKTNVLK